MSLSRDVIERLPRVEGTLNYLAPMAEKPMNLAYDPPAGVPRSNGKPEPHRMTIYDARPVAARLSLDGEGLALVEHLSAVKDFYDEDELRRVYYPEAERLVAEVTGANQVLVFDIRLMSTTPAPKRGDKDYIPDPDDKDAPQP